MTMVARSSFVESSKCCNRDITTSAHRTPRNNTTAKKRAFNPHHSTPSFNPHHSTPIIQPPSFNLHRSTPIVADTWTPPARPPPESHA